MYKLELTCSLSSGVKSTGLKNGKYGYVLNAQLLKDSLKEMKEAGINKIEFCIPGLIYCDESMKMFKKALKIVKKYKMTINTFHLPYSVDWIDFACQWPNDRKEIVKWTKKLIKKLDKFNPKAYIVHPGGKSAKPENREKFMEYLIESVNELASSTSVPICIENMVLGNLTNGLEQIKEYADKCEKGYVVIDTNHFLTDRPEDAILAIGGEKIKALHISDNDFVYERHMMPGDGLNDWNKIIGALEQIGYKGSFNYEVSMGKHGYTYKQLVENYEKLFEEYNKHKGN